MTRNAEGLIKTRHRRLRGVTVATVFIESTLSDVIWVGAERAPDRSIELTVHD